RRPSFSDDPPIRIEAPGTILEAHCVARRRCARNRHPPATPIGAWAGEPVNLYHLGGPARDGVTYPVDRIYTAFERGQPHETHDQLLLLLGRQGPGYDLRACCRPA